MVKLNFSHANDKRKQQSALMMLLLLSLIFAFVINEYFSLKQQIEQTVEIQERQSRFPKQTQLNRQDQQQSLLAKKLINELNLPWLAIYQAIELVKAESENIYLTEVDPSINKGQIEMTGQAKDLASLLIFVEHLNQHSSFNQALLLSQERLPEAGNQILFNLQMMWVNNE